MKKIDIHYLSRYNISFSMSIYIFLSNNFCKNVFFVTFLKKYFAIFRWNRCYVYFQITFHINPISSLKCPHKSSTDYLSSLSIQSVSSWYPRSELKINTRRSMSKTLCFYDMKYSGKTVIKILWLNSWRPLSWNEIITSRDEVINLSHPPPPLLYYDCKF